MIPLLVQLRFIQFVFANYSHSKSMCIYIYTVHCVCEVYTFRFLHLKFVQHVEVINHFACSKRRAERGESGRGSRGRVRKLIHFWGPKQNEYFLYFLRNTGHKIDVTFVLALEKYGRNMAALGSSCQAEFAHPFLYSLVAVAPLSCPSALCLCPEIGNEKF